MTPEQQVLLAAVQCDQSHHDHTDDLLTDDLDWSALRNMAVSHGVMPLVYTWLTAVGHDRVPTDEMEHWQMLYRRNAEHNLLLTGELLRLMRLLQTQGIVAIPLKGPALAEAAYGDVTMRQFSDLDIFVAEEDILHTSHVLLAHGYMPMDTFTARQRHAHIKRTCEFTFRGRHPTAAYSLDVHFRLAAHYIAATLDSQSVIARRQCGWLAGHEINVLAPADLLLYLCLHATVHLWARLSYICDVARVVATNHNLDWANLVQQAEVVGLRRILLLGLTLAHDMVALDLPADVAGPVEGDQTISVLRNQVQTEILQPAADPPGFVTASLFHLRAKERLQDRARYILIRAFAPTIEDWRWVDLPDRLYPLYYVLRLARLLQTGIIRPVCRWFAAAHRAAHPNDA